MPAWRLLGVRRSAPTSAADTGPMVGREREMASLREAFRLAVDDRQVRSLTIIGDAGVGKSRLTREFLASIADEAFVVRGRCLSYGRGITFWPLVEIVRHAAGIDEDDSPDRAMARIAGSRRGPGRGRSHLFRDRPHRHAVRARRGLLGRGPPASTILAERRPVVLVFDDIHWAEPTLLDLIEHLTGCRSRGTRA